MLKQTEIRVHFQTEEWVGVSQNTMTKVVTDLIEKGALDADDAAVFGKENDFRLLFWGLRTLPEDINDMLEEIISRAYEIETAECE